MIGILHTLGSNAKINASGAGNIISNTVDLRHSYYDSLSLYYCLHSTAANVSAVFWLERGPTEQGPFMIHGNSYAAIASGTNYQFNISTTNLPFMKLCAVNYSGTPTITYTCYLNYQEEY